MKAVASIYDDFQEHSSVPLLAKVGYILSFYMLLIIVLFIDIVLYVMILYYMWNDFINVVYVLYSHIIIYIFI